MRHADDLGLEEYLAAIAVARLVLGPKMRVQAPPNLVVAGGVHGAARRRGRRLGRRLPADPGPREPRAALALRWTGSAPSPPPPGSTSQPRLTVHPEYVVGSLGRGEPWLDPRVLRPRRRAGPAGGPGAGLARPGVRPEGRPWQEPDGGFAAVGRAPAAPTCTPPSTPRAAPTTAATTSTPSTATGTRSREVVPDVRAPDSADRGPNVRDYPGGARPGAARPRSGTRAGCPTSTRWP